MSKAKHVPLLNFVPRQEFPFHKVPLANFQGHHRAALQNLRQQAFKTDLVLELRDSRAPLSSINPLFDQVLHGIPKLVLYTKTDLSRLKHLTIQAWDPTQDFMRIECGLHKDAHRIHQYLKNFFKTSGPEPPLGYNLMVTGMPNVGKSTLINMLRKTGLRSARKGKNVARHGNQPGVTRNISETIRINDHPHMFIIDTPGVFVPQVRDSHQMMNLALINAVNPEGIDNVLMADYLLYHLNKQYPQGGRYPGEQTNDIEAVLRQTCKKKSKKPFDEQSAANEWLTRFRNGRLAQLCLDDTSVENYQAIMERGAKMRIDLGPMVPNHHMRKRLMM